MHLVTFTEDGNNRLGVLDRARSEVIELSRAGSGLPADMLGFIARGESALIEARRALTGGARRWPLATVHLAAPIPRPGRNIFCVGKNYRDHVQELQKPASTFAGREAIPEAPIFFTKATSSVIGPGRPIPAGLDPTHSADYEGELGVVIGPGGRAITRQDAMRLAKNGAVIHLRIHLHNRDPGLNIACQNGRCHWRRPAVDRD